MKTIRRNVFETNSSSTHSISIVEYSKPKDDNIPRKLKEIYMVDEFGDVGGGDECYDCHKHTTEKTKLRFLINMIASVYEYKEGGINEEWDYDSRENEEYKTQFFKKLISLDLFVWLKEVVYEETGTTIEYIEPSSNWFPFFETTYSEDKDITDLLNLEEEGNSYNKEKFKERIKNIIFNPNIFIENENCPYGMER